MVHSTTLPYYLIISSWVFLLLGGLLITLGVLSGISLTHKKLFPETEEINLMKFKSFSLIGLFGLLIAFSVSRMGSVIFSLLLVKN